MPRPIRAPLINWPSKNGYPYGYYFAYSNLQPDPVVKTQDYSFQENPVSFYVYGVNSGEEVNSYPYTNIDQTPPYYGSVFGGMYNVNPEPPYYSNPVDLAPGIIPIPGSYPIVYTPNTVYTSDPEAGLGWIASYFDLGPTQSLISNDYQFPGTGISYFEDAMQYFYINRTLDGYTNRVFRKTDLSCSIDNTTQVVLPSTSVDGHPLGELRLPIFIFCADDHAVISVTAYSEFLPPYNDSFKALIRGTICASGSGEFGHWPLSGYTSSASNSYSPNRCAAVPFTLAGFLVLTMRGGPDLSNYESLLISFGLSAPGYSCGI